MERPRMTYGPNGWTLHCPHAPTPAQKAFVSEWIKTPKVVDHLLNVAGVSPDVRAGALADAIAGKIKVRLTGSRGGGMGDIRLFEAPRETTTAYSFS